MESNWFEILTYFIIYSFLGWVMESVFRSINEKKIINTGFLKGPFCPIYGIGAIIMFIFLDRLENNIILLFFSAIIVLTIWEYLVGVLLEKLFKTKYWDYSDHKFNFQGRICLINSIYWGVLGTVFVKYIHPFMQNIIYKVDINLLKYIITIISITIIVDMITTIVKIKNITSTLEKVDKLNKEIKERLKEIKELKELKELKENMEKTISIENVQKLIESLNDRRNKMMLSLYKNVDRLKNAFPAINTKEIAEVLSKKLEIKEIKDKIKNKKENKE